LEYQFGYPNRNRNKSHKSNTLLNTTILCLCPNILSDFLRHIMNSTHAHGRIFTCSTNETIHMRRIGFSPLQTTSPLGDLASRRPPLGDSLSFSNLLSEEYNQPTTMARIRNPEQARGLNPDRCDGTATSRERCQIEWGLSVNGHCRYHWEQGPRVAEPAGSTFEPYVDRCHGIASSTGERCRKDFEMLPNHYCIYHQGQVPRCSRRYR
jgi:hypothetical protein